MTSHADNLTSKSPADIAKRQMKAAALNCIAGLRLTDGKVYALLKPTEEIIHGAQGWANEETLCAGLSELYKGTQETVYLTRIMVRNERGEMQDYRAVLFSGAEMVQKITEDFTTYQASRTRHAGN